MDHLQLTYSNMGRTNETMKWPITCVTCGPYSKLNPWCQISPPSPRCYVGYWRQFCSSLTRRHMALQDITNLKIRIQKNGTSYCIKAGDGKNETTALSEAKSTPALPVDGIPVHWDAIARAKWTATKFYCRVRSHAGVTLIIYIASSTRHVVKSG